MQPQQHDPEQLAAEREKIQNFVRTACDKLGWDLYPNDEVTGLVRDGLAKNRVEYGFQACPCYSFLSYHLRDAEGQPVLDPKGEPKKNMKVNCPCEPARVLDVPGTVSYASREEMEKKTENWPDRGTIIDNPDGTVTLESYHPGVCHCFLFTRKGEGKAPD
ncbi:MAG: ferredoxin-thioredoxin reductase catalytic domain-containing protein [Candidatus Sericytochromatia bacterium]